MARFRILQRPSVNDLSRPRFDVQEKVWWSRMSRNMELVRDMLALIV